MSTTGDPVDGIVETTQDGGNAGGASDGGGGAASADPETVTIARDDYAALQERVRSLESQKSIADEIRNAFVNNGMNGAVTRGVDPAPPQPTEEERMRANMEFGTDPVRRTAEIADQVATKRINDTLTPAQLSVNKKFAELAVENFKAARRDDPYYAAALPLFNQKIAQLPLEQFGASDITTLNTQFDAIWDMAIGQYSRTRTEQIRKTKAANLSAGAATGAGGGGKPRRSLQEIDRQAYETAVAAGLPQEEIDAIAAELEG